MEDIQFVLLTMPARLQGSVDIAHELRVTSVFGFRYDRRSARCRVAWGWKLSTQFSARRAGASTCCTFRWGSVLRRRSRGHVVRGLLAMAVCCRGQQPE